VAFHDITADRASIDVCGCTQTPCNTPFDGYRREIEAFIGFRPSFIPNASSLCGTAAMAEDGERRETSPTGFRRSVFFGFVGSCGIFVYQETPAPGGQNPLLAREARKEWESNWRAYPHQPHFPLGEEILRSIFSARNCPGFVAIPQN
jgi:hypothetical protein